MEQVFRDEWPASAELYLPVPEARDALPQPRPGRDLPARARRVGGRARGRARRLLPRVRRRGDRRLLARDSLLDGDDLASWQASIEQPVTRAYHGWEVSKTGPWGQGPVFLQQLALLDGFELGDRESADFVHTVVECAKLAFADREAWYGDVEVPLDDLLSPAYADERRKLVGEEASGELRPGSPGGREPRLPHIPAARGRARRPASRPAATPVTSTWSTASATPSRRRRAAAGCTARR